MKVTSSLSDLQKQLKKTQPNKTLVFTNGCFDLLHVGHIRYLKEAKSLGDILVVGLNTDQSVSKLKGPGRPIQSEQERAEILSALECVDYVVTFSEDTPLNLIQHLKPDVLVKGGDWKGNPIIGSDFVSSYGGVVETLSWIKGVSSTELIQRICQVYGHQN